MSENESTAETTRPIERYILPVHLCHPDDWYNVGRMNGIFVGFMIGLLTVGGGFGLVYVVSNPDVWLEIQGFITEKTISIVDITFFVVVLVLGWVIVHIIKGAMRAHKNMEWN